MDFFRYAQNYYGDWLRVQLLPQAALLLVCVVILFLGLHRLRRSTGEPAATENGGTENLSGEKYQLGARLYHWGNALFIIMLIVSGLALMVPRSLRPVLLSWVKIHEIFAALYVLGLLVHIIASLTRGEPKTMWFAARDWADVKTIAANFFGRTKGYPRFGKYDPLQKVYHALLTILSVLIIFSGVYLFLSVEVITTFTHEWLRWQRLLHDISAAAFLAIIVGHLYFGLIRVNWPTLAAIVTGKISAGYFRLRHSADRWKPR